jgi:predicted nucleic acid-binding protein
MTETESGIYLDTNAFVYAVQAGTEMAAPMLHFFSEMARLKRKPLTSELTLAEVLCKKDLTPALHEVYRDLLIESETVELVQVTREIIFASAEMRRAGAPLKLQDAIHVATAMSTRCKFMLTNDAGVRVPPNGMVVLPPTHEGIAQILSALHV